MRSPHASPGSDRFRLAWTGHDQEDLCDSPQVVPVSLVSSPGTPAPVGNFLVEALLESGVIASGICFVCDGRHGIPLVGYGVLQPGETLGVSAAPHIRTTLNTLDWKLPEPNPSDEDKLPSPQGESPGSLVGNMNILSSPGPELLPSSFLSKLEASITGGYHRPAGTLSLAPSRHRLRSGRTRMDPRGYSPFGIRPYPKKESVF